MNRADSTSKRKRAFARARGLGLVAALVLGLAPAGSTQEAWEAVPGGWVSGPVSYLSTIPIDSGGGIGATLHGKNLYVTTLRGFTIYDISDATSPQLISTT